MIRELLPEMLVLATAGLVALPIVALRVRAAFRPVELTRFNAVTMSSGMIFLLIALLLCSVPLVVTIGGGSVIDRHFFPGGALIGWVSALGAVLLMVAFIVGFRRAWKVETKLTIEEGIGVHHDMGTYRMVILKVAQPLAYAIGGNDPQVVITTGLVEVLTPCEVAAVVEHEAAHLSLGHRPHLILIGMLKPIASIFAPARKLVDAALLALETAADSRTRDLTSTRGALLKLSGVAAAPGVAAFTAGDVVARLNAMDEFDRPLSLPTRAGMYAMACGLVGISLTTLVVFWL
ncbi:MAG: M48 family metalloprotease [Acidimicrobiia bacterium]|nr:M48 family metalloprotease [Acidimicrobiia bacterium]